ncbi:hypothetical protein RvY_17935 [Ramazzottius varieornatus]|uniref:Uncharacterized protein n=1 Tax=Ramazzottius varieornatus TaxID=947166 RepID=A0A1D1WAD8_RAMVA|nr:hypothetical protein RvY_17935 [Ramazzottius varieornatus]
MVEYAQELYNRMEHRCDVQKRSLMDDHFIINALQVHQRDVMLVMQNVLTLPRPGQVARG